MAPVLPLLVFIVTLMAVPLSRVNPRQGRFLKLLPAILLYMAYLTMLIAARGALEKGKIPWRWACGGCMGSS
jgi:lipopolysaccharide export system permease protein